MSNFKRYYQDKNIVFITIVTYNRQPIVINNIELLNTSNVTNMRSMFQNCGRLRPSSPRLLSWGMISNGVCITAPISESHSNESGCTLLDILIEDVPEKYFLSPVAMQKLSASLFRDHKDSESTPQEE